MPSTYRNRTIHVYRDLIAQKGIRSVSSVHKAGVRSTNQMEVRAARDRGEGFPPGAGAVAFLWDWCVGDSGPLGCMFEGRCGAGQGALGWEAGRTADRGAGEGQAPKEQGLHPWEHRGPHHNSPMVHVGSSESILRDFGICLASDTTQQHQ